MYLRTYVPYRTQEDESEEEFEEDIEEDVLDREALKRQAQTRLDTLTHNLDP